MTAAALELRNISRRFGEVIANQQVTLTVLPGEIHAVVGENGAGKSTLLQIAAGLQSADSGQVWIQGQFLDRPSPARAIAFGLGMVQQHFLLLPPHTVAENVVLGAEPRRGFFLDRTRAEADVAALSKRFGLRVDPAARVQTLSVGERQRVEILKALYRDARVLILDEPTAVLAPVEVDELFTVLRALVAAGRTVIFVTHKLREVMAVSDRVTVLRRGKVMATLRTSETSISELAERMVGDAIANALVVEASSPSDGPVLEKMVLESSLISSAEEGLDLHGVGLETGALTGGPNLGQATSSPIEVSSSDCALWITDLLIQSARDHLAVKRLSLHVRSGEIVGVAGVEGNGQAELADAIAGLLPYQGQIVLAGRSLEGLSPGRRLKAGLGHIPADRRARGLILSFSIADNLILGKLEAFASRGVFSRAAIQAHAEGIIRNFDIRPPFPGIEAGALSGGNQQKIVVARELERRPRLLLAAQPTRGVDIGAMGTIHAALRKTREEGAGVLLISADLQELLALSDRIIVLYRGQIAGELSRGEASEQALGMLMVGGKPNE